MEGGGQKRDMWSIVLVRSRRRKVAMSGVQVIILPLHTKERSVGLLLKSTLASYSKCRAFRLDLEQ
jgi:hypothetical protein